MASAIARLQPVRAACPAGRGWAGTGPCASPVPIPCPPCSRSDAVEHAVASARPAPPPVPRRCGDVGRAGRPGDAPPRSPPAAPPRTLARQRRDRPPRSAPPTCRRSPPRRRASRRRSRRSQPTGGRPQREPGSKPGCRARSARSLTCRSTPGSRDSPGTTVPPPSRMTCSAIASRSAVLTPDRAAVHTSASVRATSAPATRMASISPGVFSSMSRPRHRASTARTPASRSPPAEGAQHACGDLGNRPTASTLTSLSW